MACGALLVRVSVGTVFFVWKPPSKWPVQTPSREGGATVGDVPPSCEGGDSVCGVPPSREGWWL